MKWRRGHNEIRLARNSRERKELMMTHIVKSPFGASAAAMALSVTLSLPAIISAQVTPTPETPGRFLHQTDPPRFLSRWDNPVMQGQIILRADQFTNRPDDNNWEYFKFDLWGVTKGTVNNPNLIQSNTLDTWP